MLVFVLYAFFASVFTIAKLGLAHTTPLFLVGSRMAVAGLLMLGYLYCTQPQQFAFKRKHWWRLFQLALFNIYLTNVCEFWGLQYLSSFKTCFIYSLCPFLSALLSYFAFSETMTKKKWVGMFIGFIGFLPILLSEDKSEESLSHLSFFSWAEIAVIFAAAFSVYGWVVLRQLIKEDGFTPLMANAVAMLMGGIMALIHSFLIETWDPIPLRGDLFSFLQYALLLIIISNFICYNLYGYLLQKYTATFISFAGWTTPIFTALFGWFILNESISWPFFLSAAIVLIGLLIFYQAELSQGYYIKKESKK